MTINFPTILTLTRLIIGPLIVPFLIVYLIPCNNIIINCAVGGLFILLSITDLLDGYLARKFNNETELGKLLDYMADKFLMYSSLIGLIAAHKIFFVWVLIFIGREFFVMGLRLLAQDYQLSVPVSYLGKLKTMSQFAYIAAAIINPYHDQSFVGSSFNLVEKGLLAIALFLTVYSAYRYYMDFLKALSNKQIASGSSVPLESHLDREGI